MIRRPYTRSQPQPHRAKPEEEREEERLEEEQLEVAPGRDGSSQKGSTLPCLAACGVEREQSHHMKPETALWKRRT